MSVQTEARSREVMLRSKQCQYIALNLSSLASATSILAIEAFVLAPHNAQFMIYTSSKQRGESYTTLVYSDKQLSLHVHCTCCRHRCTCKIESILHVIIWNLWHLRNLLTHCKIKPVLWSRTWGIYLQTDVWHIDRGTSKDKCGAHSGSPRLHWLY